MKHAKRFVCLLLAMVMVFALGITAFAESGSITVDNPQKGTDGNYLTYTAYKIFDVVYDEKTVDGNSVAGDHYAYTISTTNPWFETVAKYALTGSSTEYAAGQSSYTGSNGLTLTATANDPTKYVVTADKSVFSAPNFAKALQDALKVENFNPTGTALTIDNTTGKATASNLPLGYYFVSSSSGALCNLTTTNPTATIHDKNDIPFDKVDDQESVDVGQTVNYTITGKVPDTTGFTSYTYEISDKMTKGLTPNLTVSEDKTSVTAGITIKVNNTDVTDWTITPIYGLYDTDGKPTTKDSSNADVTSSTTGAVVVGFTATINMIDGENARYTVGDKIEVTYSATVNENAAAKIENNSATLTYSNDPTSEEKKTTPEDKETVYSAKIVIDKYAKNATDSNNTDSKLAGAEFVLYRWALKTGDTLSFTTKDSSNNDVPVTEETSGSIKAYYKWDETNKKVEWVTLAENQTVADAITAGSITAKTTIADGSASFDGIADGTYYLLETKAPDGYNLLPAPVTVTVNGTTAKADNLSALTVTEKVENETGGLLPSTGGIGTTVFYIIGGVLVIGAGVLLVVRRRMGKDD